MKIISPTLKGYIFLTLIFQILQKFSKKRKASLLIVWLKAFWIGEYSKGILRNMDLVFGFKIDTFAGNSSALSFSGSPKRFMAIGNTAHNLLYPKRALLQFWERKKKKLRQKHINGMCSSSECIQNLFRSSWRV